MRSINIDDMTESELKAELEALTKALRDGQLTPRMAARLSAIRRALHAISQIHRGL